MSDKARKRKERTLLQYIGFSTIKKTPMVATEFRRSQGETISPISSENKASDISENVFLRRQLNGEVLTTAKCNGGIKSLKATDGPEFLHIGLDSNIGLDLSNVTPFRGPASLPARWREIEDKLRGVPMTGSSFAGWFQSNKKDDFAAVDCWPSMASSNTGKKTLDTPKNKLSDKASEEELLKLSRRRANTAKKPPLLQNLEAFLEEELKKLSIETTQENHSPQVLQSQHILRDAAEKRLRVFAQAFDILINSFSLYANILSSIKREYDSAVSMMRNEAIDVERLRVIANTCQDEIQRIQSACDERIHILNTRYADQLQHMSSRVTEAEFSLATEMIQNRELSSELKKAKDDAELYQEKYERIMEEKDTLQARITEVDELENRAEKFRAQRDVFERMAHSLQEKVKKMVPREELLAAQYRSQSLEEELRNSGKNHFVALGLDKDILEQNVKKLQLKVEDAKAKLDGLVAMNVSADRIHKAQERLIAFNKLLLKEEAKAGLLGVQVPWERVDPYILAKSALRNIRQAKKDLLGGLEGGQMPKELSAEQTATLKTLHREAEMLMHVAAKRAHNEAKAHLLKLRNSGASADEIKKAEIVNEQKRLAIEKIEREISDSALTIMKEVEAEAEGDSANEHELSEFDGSYAAGSQSAMDKMKEDELAQDEEMLLRRKEEHEEQLPQESKELDQDALVPDSFLQQLPDELVEMIKRMFGWPITLKTLYDVIARFYEDNKNLKEELEIFAPSSIKEEETKDPLQTMEWSKEKFFESPGVGEEVPKYLRFPGKIRNRNLAKRDTELFIKDVWKEKIKQKNTDKMEDFFYVFLLKRFGIQAMIAEWGYNIVNSLKRYSYDADCELFYKVLTGELDESIYHDQMQMLGDLQAYFRKSDELLHGGKRSKKLTKGELITLLRRFFPDKTVDQFREIRIGLDEDIANEWQGLSSSDAQIAYEKLFEEDREANQGQFAESIRDQHVQEREKFIAELKLAVKQTLEMEDEEPFSPDKMLTKETAREALTRVDEGISEKTMEDYIRRSFIKGEEEVEAELFIRRISSGVVRKSKGMRALSTAIAMLLQTEKKTTEKVDAPQAGPKTKLLKTLMAKKGLPQ